MQIIFFTKFLAGMDIREIANACTTTGFDGVDVAIRDDQCVNPGNVTTALPEAVKHWQAVGLSIPLATLPGDAIDPEDAAVRAIYAACGRAGVPFIKLGYWPWTSGEHYWDGVRRIRTALEKFAAMSRDHGVCTLFHTHSNACYGSNASGVMHLVEGFDTREVAVYLDPAHLAFDGEQLAMGIDIVRHHLRMIGVKTAGYTSHAEEARTHWTITLPLLPHGLVDWPEALKLLQAVEYDGPFSYHGEIDGYMTPERILEGAAMDLAYLRSIGPGASP